MEGLGGKETDRMINHLEANAGEREEQDGVEDAKGHQLPPEWSLATLPCQPLCDIFSSVTLTRSSKWKTTSNPY